MATGVVMAEVRRGDCSGGRIRDGDDGGGNNYGHQRGGSGDGDRKGRHCGGEFKAVLYFSEARGQEEDGIHLLYLHLFNPALERPPML